MLDQHFGKVITIILIAIISIFAFMIYSSNQSHQDYLEQEIQTLKNQVEEQDSTIEKNNQQLLEESQQQAAELLEKQTEINQLKEKELDKKLEQIETVVTDLEKQQEEEKELRDQHLKMSENALTAAYLAQGIQTASMFKMHVAEYYMSEGRMPKSNKQLGLPRANSYATDVIESIWVTYGGKITVVYKQLKGQDKGAISLVPKYKNDQLLWKCVTRDFVNIQQFMPQCSYSLAQ